jgi:hypothetical protein
MLLLILVRVEPEMLKEQQDSLMEKLPLQVEIPRERVGPLNSVI